MVNQNKSVTSDPGITIAQIEAIADQLSNNEYSSDTELKQFLIEEVNIPPIIAIQALKLRSTFLINPLANLVYEKGYLKIRNIKLLLE